MDKNIACIGGGTGLFALLSGLKASYPGARLTAIVSMMDSGGSTGRLRDEFGYLPPGDVRKCLVALSNAPQRLRLLMDYRFSSGEGLKGHSLGNLMLTALKDQLPGTPEEKEYRAIEAMEDILNIHGSVLPVTLSNCHLVATYSDGSTVEGEADIDVPKHDASLRITSLALKPEAEIFVKTKRALLAADIIVIGPGDLYTSIIPNLLVTGMRETLEEAKGNGSRIVYVVNAMTKHGETDGYAASDFVARIEALLGSARIDAILVNDGTISDAQRAAYAKEHAALVTDDIDRARKVIAYRIGQQGFARPSPEELARCVAAAAEGS